MWLTPLLQGAAQQQAEAASGLWLRNVSFYTSGSGGSGQANPGKPAGTQSTDVLVAILCGGWNPGLTVSPPSGWTQVLVNSAPIGPRLYVYWALGSVASTQFFVSQTGGQFLLPIFAYAGADTSTPIRAVLGGYSETTSIAAPSVTAQAGDALVHAWFDSQTSPSLGTTITPGGVAQRVSSQNNFAAAVGFAATTGATSAQSRSAANFTAKFSATVAIAAAPTSAISRPNSDITVTGWIGSPDNVNLYNNIDEVTPSDADFILSPDITGGPGPAIFGISPSQPAGTLDIRIQASRTGASGDIRALLLDGTGATVGTSSWQTLTASPAQYVLTVTTTGTAERVRLEVRA